jgi:hypothetical protein
VLGFSAVQLATARDPGALHAEPSAPGADLKSLIARGWLTGLPAWALEPAWPAASPVERTALGYLHGNCGHCHNPQGPLRNVGLYLRQGAGEQHQPAVASTFGQRVKQPAPGQSADAALRIEPHHPERSALLQRMSSRYGALQMPPLGTALVDDAAVDLIRRWIAGREADPQTTFPQN